MSPGNTTTRPRRPDQNKNFRRIPDRAVLTEGNPGRVLPKPNQQTMILIEVSRADEEDTGITNKDQNFFLVVVKIS